MTYPPGTRGVVLEELAYGCNNCEEAEATHRVRIYITQYVHVYATGRYCSDCAEFIAEAICRGLPEGGES